MTNIDGVPTLSQLTGLLNTVQHWQQDHIIELTIYLHLPQNYVYKFKHHSVLSPQMKTLGTFLKL